VRLAIAQLKVKKLEEEQRLKAMEFELEKQRLQIEMERELLGARVEVEQAQIELSDGNGDSGDVRNRSLNLPLLPEQTLHKTVRRYLVSCDEDWRRPVLTSPLQPKKNLPKRDISGLPVISPPGSFATNQLATKRPSCHQPSRHQAKSTRHQTQ